MPESLTTVQLAERIARAVLHAVDSDQIKLAPHDGYYLSRNVHETGHWFCRLTDTPQGTRVEQLDLWP